MKTLIQLILGGCFIVALAVLQTVGLPPTSALAASCESAVKELNGKLPPRIDEAELVDILRNLNRTGNRHLPAKFVTIQEAKAAGWRPGQNLWALGELRGKSLGGDRFGNYEKKLPNGKRKWREADLDYQGGHRGPKRLIFSTDGLRMVTVDHYQTFKEVPACQ